MFRLISKIFLVILLLDSAISLSKETQNNPSRASKEEAAEVLAQVKEATKTGRDEALSQIEKYPEICYETTNFTVTEGTILISSESATFVQNLEEIKASADSAGLDISDCLIHREDQIYELNETGIFILQECVTGMYGTVNQITTACKRQAVNVYGSVENIEMVFSVCEDADEECFDEVIDFLTLNDFPAAIQSYLAGCAVTISHMQGLISDCVNSGFNDVYGRGYDLILGIRDCVVNLQK